VFSENGQRLFVAYGADPGGISIFDLTGLTSTIVFSSDYQDDNYELYRINDNGAGLRRLTRDKAADVSPRFGPSGRYLAFISDRPLAATPERKDPHIWIHDSTTGETVPLVRTNPNGEPTREGITFDWSPDGAAIAFIDGTGNSIHAVNVTTGLTKPLLTIKDVTTLDQKFSAVDAFRSLTWYASTNSILFSCRPRAAALHHDIFQLDVVTRRVEHLNPQSTQHTAHMSPCPSPQGNQLAVIRQASGTEGDTRHLAILDRRDLATVAEANAGDGMAATPCYAADGQFVYFTAATGPHRQIFRVPATGGVSQPITHFEGQSIQPDTVSGSIFPVIDHAADVELRLDRNGNE
jgi:Tol biopolymer transport system component